MNEYAEIMRMERSRTMNYGADYGDETEIKCPVCGSSEWDFLLKDCHGDLIGCEECVSKIYYDELF
ncbi:MAG: hypothetical protein IK057_06510 [Clostridia bacterium]|nr:hypothetical protein [Clostridia bacterium]